MTLSIKTKTTNFRGILKINSLIINKQTEDQTRRDRCNRPMYPHNRRISSNLFASSRDSSQIKGSNFLSKCQWISITTVALDSMDNSNNNRDNSLDKIKQKNLSIWRKSCASSSWLIIATEEIAVTTHTRRTNFLVNTCTGQVCVKRPIAVCSVIKSWVTWKSRSSW